MNLHTQQYQPFFQKEGWTNTWIFVMGGDPTFFGSVAETTNLYLQHFKKGGKHRKEENKSLTKSQGSHKNS